MKVSMFLPDVLDGLTELSDREIQIKLWLHGDKDGMSSFTEAICGVFDDGRVTRSMEEGTISEPLLGLFKKLDALIDRIPEHVVPGIIIDHSSMPELRAVASNLLQILQEQKSESDSPRGAEGGSGSEEINP
ncbi:MAG: hypothetical protein V5783_00850 [Pontiella sp.]